METLQTISEGSGIGIGAIIGFVFIGFLFLIFLLAFLYGISLIITKKKAGQKWLGAYFIISSLVFSYLLYNELGLKYRDIKISKEYFHSLSSSIKKYNKNPIKAESQFIIGKAIVIFQDYDETTQMMLSKSLYDRGILAKKPNELRSLIYISVNREKVVTRYTVKGHAGVSYEDPLIIHDLIFIVRIIDLSSDKIIAGPKYFHGSYLNHPDALGSFFNGTPSGEDLLHRMRKGSITGRNNNVVRKELLASIEQWLADIPVQ